jgi:predicted nucleic acid-binding protein
VTLLVADTSAWHHARHPAVLNEWEREIQRVAVTPPARLEILYSARSRDDYLRTSMRLDALHQIDCGSEAFGRALQVQEALARKAALHHRSVGFADLLIAAAAELAAATVWHYDSDYDRIAEITGQPTEWVVPRGSL